MQLSRHPNSKIPCTKSINEKMCENTDTVCSVFVFSLRSCGFTEEIVMTPTKKGKTTIIAIEKKMKAQIDSTQVAHQGGGQHSGLVINKQNAGKCPPASSAVRFSGSGTRGDFSRPFPVREKYFRKKEGTLASEQAALHTHPESIAPLSMVGQFCSNARRDSPTPCGFGVRV